jgi:predicted O-methyltransferase YrrM
LHVTTKDAAAPLQPTWWPKKILPQGRLRRRSPELRHLERGGIAPMMDALDSRLKEVKQAAHGKLPLDVYRRIHDSARACGGGNLVEIGTSQGAATIAMALGAKAGGKPFRIVTCDPFITGSRPRGASVAEKAAIVRRGFERFGVAEVIELVIGDVNALAASGKASPIGLLMIDADGQVDRDLALLFERLVADCPIIIDDVDDRTYLHRRGRRLQVDQKHRISHLLLGRLVELGFLAADPPSGQTGWYRKGPRPASAADIEQLALGSYRSLIYTEVGVRDLSLKYRLHEYVAERAPWALHAYRRLRRREM